MVLPAVFSQEPSSSQPSSSQPSSSQPSSSQPSSSQQQNNEICKKKEHHKKLFYDEISRINQAAAKRHETNAHNTSSVIDRAKANEIIAYLTKPLNEIINYNSSKMHHIKKQGYNVQEIEGKEVLFRNGASENKTKTKLNVNSDNLPVAIQEDYFEILFNIHCLQKAHCGQNFIYFKKIMVVNLGIKYN